MIHCHIAPSRVFYGEIVLALSCERVRTFNYYFDSVHAVNAEVRVHWGLCNLTVNVMQQGGFNMPTAQQHVKPGNRCVFTTGKPYQHRTMSKPYPF